MRSPEATSDLTWRLNEARSSRGIFEKLEQFAHAGRVVHPLAHQREDLFA